MGLDDIIKESYEIGEVKSKKNITDVPMNKNVLKMLIHETHGEHADVYFSQCSEEEIKAVIQRIDDELQSSSPFDYQPNGTFAEHAEKFREGLVEML